MESSIRIPFKLNVAHAVFVELSQGFDCLLKNSGMKANKKYVYRMSY